MNSYQPFWPEVIIFWGAGATRSLGMSTTNELGKKISVLAQKQINVNERVQKALGSSDEGVCDFFTLLESEGNFENARGILDKQFLSAENGKAYYKHLTASYDWKALRELIMICPGYNSDNFQLMDLFNMIDMHLVAQQGIKIKKEQEPKSISPERLSLARNTLVMLIVLIQSLAYQKVIKDRDGRTILAQYQDFADILAKFMQEEGLYLYRDNTPLNKREFYLFSYAVISMNWDPLLLWFIFNAHKKLNDSCSPYIGQPTVPLKLFNDMGHFMGVRQVDGNDPAVRYPMNETVVQRLNDPEHQSRRIRIGKFYFPHGSFNWRECPYCGKLSMWLGNSWGTFSESLFPPTLLPDSMDINGRVRSTEEENAIKLGILDAIQCPHCGAITDTRHTPTIMQSSFKGNPPSFVEEVQRDMRITLEHTKHLIFIGYSLPPDDFIYRSLLAARTATRNEKVFCSIVGYQEGIPDHWITKGSNEYFEYISKKNSDLNETVKQITDIFGNSVPVRVDGQGFPNVILDQETGCVSEFKVRELIYPRKLFPQGRVERVI